MTAFFLAVLIDALSFSWPNRLHPVAWFGIFAEWLERGLYRTHHPRSRQLVRGAVLATIAPIVAVGAVLLLRASLGAGLLSLTFETFILAASFTLTGLIRAAREMETALRSNDLPRARHGLQSLCSRDPTTLSSEALVAATVESVAENTSDSWVAPLCWFAVLGLPGVVIYRCVNTLDAMVGYRGRYEYFGKTAAKLDDLLNLLPSRLTALIFWVVAPEGSTPRRDAWSIWRRYRNSTESPNAGQPMAMMAALLGVRLEKLGHYALGEARRPIVVDHIQDACRIARRGAWVMVLLAIGLRAIVVA